MSVELFIGPGIALFVSLSAGLFNYYKLKDDQDSWEQEQEISINKKILFRMLKKRYKLYKNIFKLLGEVRDIDYPIEHYKELEGDKKKLKIIADLILKELYGEAGLFMSYETRSIILKVYQNSYRYSNNEIALNDLIDSYYLGRRALRLDLEFDDSKSSKSSDKILKNTIKKEKKIELNNFTWKIENKLAYSPRPGYPNKTVSLNILNSIVKVWKHQGIKSIICLLSNEEINEYYQAIDYDLVGFYKKNGFDVCHVSIVDFQNPPVNEIELEKIVENYKKLELPLLVHCGAGQDRSGYTVEYLESDMKDRGIA